MYTKENTEERGCTYTVSRCVEQRQLVLKSSPVCVDCSEVNLAPIRLMCLTENDHTHMFGCDCQDFMSNYNVPKLTIFATTCMLVGISYNATVLTLGTIKPSSYRSSRCKLTPSYMYYKKLIILVCCLQLITYVLCTLCFPFSSRKSNHDSQNVNYYG